MDTWTPPEAPAYDGNGQKVTPRLITADFGNGYKQVIPDGPTPLDKTATYTWGDLSPANLAAIETFLYAHIGQTFYWTPPLETSPTKWRWTDASKTTTGRANVSITINFERSFEL